MKLFLAAALAILWSPSARADSGISCPAVSTTETPAIQLALALQDRIRASDPAARKESELRLSAALDRSGLIRAAHSGYRVVLGSNEATPSDRARALACMNRIQQTDPALSRLEDSSILRGVATREFPARSEAGEFLFRQFTLALREAPRRADELASLLESALPGSLEAALARSFLLAREKKPLEALRMLTPLLASDRWPASLERHRNAEGFLPRALPSPSDNRSRRRGCCEPSTSQQTWHPRLSKSCRGRSWRENAPVKPSGRPSSSSADCSHAPSLPRLRWCWRCR